MIGVFKVAEKFMQLILAIKGLFFTMSRRGIFSGKCNWQAGLYAELVHLKKIVRRNLVIRRPIFYH